MEVDDSVDRGIDSREDLRACCEYIDGAAGVSRNERHNRNPEGNAEGHCTVGGVVLGRLLSTLAVCAATCCNILVAS